MSDAFRVKNGVVVNNDLLVANATSRKVGVLTNAPVYSVDINSTDGVRIPVGNTSNRPSGANGVLRYNTQTSSYEGYANTGWVTIAQADANNTVFAEVTVPTVKFETTANNSILYNNNTITTRVGNTNIMFSNSSFSNTLGLSVFSDRISIGANNIANTTALFVGNSTTNNVITQSSVRISNSTSNINFTIPTSTQAASGSHYLNANGSYVQVTFAPSGSNTNIQFNDSGTFGSTNAITFNKVSNTLTVSNTITATTFVGTLAGAANTVVNISNTQIISSLGYTPVTQSGGFGQDNTRVYIGWLPASNTLGVYIGLQNYGTNWPINARNISDFSINQNLSNTSSPTFASMTLSGNAVLHAGNFQTYAPALNGGGATGTWPISISGNANTANSVNGTVNGQHPIYNVTKVFSSDGSGGTNYYLRFTRTNNTTFDVLYMNIASSGGGSGGEGGGG